jgi:hypothetical protein
MPRKTSTAEAVVSAVRSVTKNWARQRKAEERNSARRANRYRRLIRVHEPSMKEVAWEVMERAYMKASANNTLPANARQVMYAARPLIQERTEKPLNDDYFTQQLLPDYLAEHPDLDWDIVYDVRGHFREPHTRRSIELGTLNVRDYLVKLRPPRFDEAEFSAPAIETYGPDSRFGAVMFVEKEGFDEILREVRLAQRYDIAIMSTKGVSVTAARRLIDRICSRYGIPLLVLHDFDKSGFSILGTLSRSNRRYEFEHNINVVDLGLRLVDVEAFDLEDRYEDAFDKGDPESRRRNMLANGATEEEAEILLDQRIELNALASDELVDFIEQKLQQNGIQKIVPGKNRLVEAYELFARPARVQKIIDEAIEGLEDERIKVPGDLEERVRKHLTEHPEFRWDRAVSMIAGVQAAEEDDDDQAPDDEDEDSA